MIRLLLYSLCFITINFVFAEDNKCTVEESEAGKKRLCFFALNGPEESQRAEQSKAGLNCIQPSDGSKIQCDSDEIADAGTMVDLEIKEFYANTGDSPSVSKAFEEMTKTRCDGLVISGHHVGYYTGEKTDQTSDTQGNRDPSKVTLNLKFLEKLSCLKEGANSNCRKWFSNIRYVHLHGSHTSGDKVLEHEGKSGLDDLALSRMKKYPKGWTKASAQYLNREYASTVDDNNSLSSRYLKMFPSAQIYSWAVAPTINQGSPETFIEHLKLMTANADIAIEDVEDVVPDASILENILNALSASSEPEPKCVKLTVGDKRGKEINAISADSKEEEDDKREIGCNFSEAIESGDQEKIMTALTDVLNEGALHQNLNRIFYALNYDSPLSTEVKQAIREKLKTSEPFRQALEGQINNKKIGVVKRADALYLYKQVYPENYESGDLENQFIGDLNSLYDQQGSDTIGTAMKEMIAELIWKNNLGSSPASQANMQALIDKLGAESNDVHLRQHTELIRISSGVGEENRVKNIFEELFTAERDEFRDARVLIRRWVDLQIQNGGDLSVIKEMYDSAVADYLKNQTDENLRDKWEDIIFGVGSGLAVRKENCVGGEFPLSEDKFKIHEKDREKMIGRWKEICEAGS
ncbi:MAG: hypothetical protein OXK80_03975 [Bdellovibrionales bacterium]|nr:hypothetical protein [Bdellovibrionales bacterium]